MAATATASPTYSPQITMPATSAGEAARKAQALSTIARNISVENLEMLALKSNKAGINDKIKQYAIFI